MRVEFLLKTDSGYPKDTGVKKPWQPLGIPSAITPIGQLHQSPPSPFPGDLGRGPSHQSTCSNIEPRMDRIKIWHVRNPVLQSIRLRGLLPCARANPHTPVRRQQDLSFLLSFFSWAWGENPTFSYIGPQKLRSLETFSHSHSLSTD